MADSATVSFGFGTPWADQVEFLRQKLALPTERWDQIMREAHDRAFVVAGAMNADLLADLHQAVVSAAESGKGLQAFRRDFKAIVARHGWTGWTGEDSKEGIAWRTRVIFQTNMATSYAAARYKQLTDPEYLKLRPFWRYIHAEHVAHPRPQHLAWHGLTLRHDDAFWQTHFPPNGWGCHCRVTAVSEAEGLRSAKAGLGEPPAGWDAIDPKTGAQVGIDRSFDYTPGASVKKPLRELIDQKLITVPASVGADMWQALKPVLKAERQQAWAAMVTQTRETMRAGGTAMTVHTVEPGIVAALAERKVVLENAAVWMRDTELLHGMRDRKAARGAAMDDDVWADLPALLETATPYLDTQDGTLLYAIDLGARLGKVVVRVNYNEKGWFNGVRDRIVSNFVATGGMVDRFNLEDARYVPLK